MTMGRRALLLALLAAGCSGERAPRRSLVLVTLDTTRADALSCLGGPAGATPELDRLAGEGVVFERAYTTAPLTLPAHSSLLTGLYPPRHGVRDNGATLPASAATLAELARDAGYQTAAFVGALVLDPAFGIDQGFERFGAPPRAPAGNGEHAGERPARAVVDEALAWLAARDRERPFLLWVHVYDPHTPYAPPAEFAGASLRERYLGEVRSVDRELARLWDALRAEGELERALVIVAGDHGEGLGEHGELGHSVHCYETTLRVPLIVRAGGWPRFAAGSRTSELVGLADLLPSASEALGHDVPPGLDGRSFWREPPPRARGLYFESYYGYLSFGWSPVTGWLDERGKYLHATRPRFFALAEDPLEERDLVLEASEAVRDARRSIGEVASAPALAPDGAGGGAEDLLEELQGLGYAGMSAPATPLPHLLEETGLPNPEDMQTIYGRALDGIELAQRGELAAAEEVFLEVLAANPRNYTVLDHLATCQIQARRFADAAATLQRIVDQSPGAPPGIFAKLAACLRESGEEAAAIDALRRAVELAPERREWREELIALLRAADRADEAEAWERLEQAGGGR